MDMSTFADAANIDRLTSLRAIARSRYIEQIHLWLNLLNQKKEIKVLLIKRNKIT